jgi:SEC-C motif
MDSGRPLRGFRNDEVYAVNPARQRAAFRTHRRLSCASIAISKTSPAFSISRKRRKSYPSETDVKRGRRFVHGDVELAEKLGRNDLCPCGSGRRFQDLLPEVRRV